MSNTTPPTDKREDLEHEFGCLEILHNCAYGIGIRDADAIDNCVSAVRNVMLQSPPAGGFEGGVEKNGNGYGYLSWKNQSHERKENGNT